MPKNRTGGKKGRKQSSKGVNLDTKIEFPDDDEEIGVINKLLGNRRMMVTCCRPVLDIKSKHKSDDCEESDDTEGSSGDITTDKVTDSETESTTNTDFLMRL